MENRRWENRFEYGAALERAGYDYLDSGFYSAVYAKPRARTVVKIGPATDGWPTYIAWAVKNGFAGNLAPKVKSFKLIKTPNKSNAFYVAEIERLQDGHGRGMSEVSEHQNKLRPASEVPPSYRPFVKGLQKLKDENKRLRFDLHSANFMTRRNGQFVVTDPLAGRSNRSGERAYRSLSQTLSKRKRQSARAQELAA